AAFCLQAGDGIRDRNVTGVQTCALPILPDAGGTSTQAQMDTPSATMTPQDVASATGASTGADCGGSSIAPSGDFGQVTECPGGEIGRAAWREEERERGRRGTIATERHRG